MNTLALFGSPMQMVDLIVLGILGLLIFGKRLPEVGKNLGKGIVEFKKGLSGIEDDVTRSTTPLPRSDDRKSIDAPSSVEDLQAENARLRAQLSEKSQHGV